MEQWLEILIKLLISLAASGLIGLEREVTGHKAGIRTQILVGIGATSFIMLGVYSDMEVSEQGRILAGLATGLGFLGAGAIMKEGLNVKGLTTAASIWVNASIGAAIGMGEYTIGLLAAALTLIVLSIFAVIERLFRLKQEEGTISLIMSSSTSGLRNILSSMEKKGITIIDMKVGSVRGGKKVNISVKLRRSQSVYKVIEEIGSMDIIKEIKWIDIDDSGPLNYLENLK